MAELKWLPQALRDLDSIEGYYLEVSPGYASIFVAGVFERVHSLAQMPELGRIVPEINDPQIRELLHRGYRIIYFYDAVAKSVEILTLTHSAKLFGGSKER
ncbi:MAG: hypothetical protein BMS9Abin05_0247 [Rhodothermia bacterium]|nr:MAG: hypothetical protein BMS9Abin05_0247 [Rhodothermia bacterium]